jgi:glutaredoxin-like YruB-family protein
MTESWEMRKWLKGASPKTMRLILLALLLPLPLRADLYTWTDDQGVLHAATQLPAKAPPKAKVKKIKSEPASAYDAPASTGPAGDLRFLRGAGAPATVELYVTSWCPYCRKAHDYLASKGVAFQEFNVEKDTQAHDRFKSFGGSGVPLVVINGQPVRGYSPGAYDALLNRDRQ